MKMFLTSFLLLSILFTSKSFAIPQCKGQFNKKTFYDHEEKKLLYCLDGKWREIDFTGEQGDTGEDGQQGAKGPTGDRGAGITSVTINESGDFVFVYGDGVSCTTTVGP